MLDWGKYIATAKKFQYKATAQDRGDLNHDIIIALADSQIRLDSNGGGQLSDVAMLRIASYQCQKYWRRLKRQLDNGLEVEHGIELLLGIELLQA